jgi:hypothetical protein
MFSLLFQFTRERENGSKFWKNKISQFTREREGLRWREEGEVVVVVWKKKKTSVLLLVRERETILVVYGKEACV